MEHRLTSLPVPMSCVRQNMARPGIHPMLNVVRIVLSNGASYFVPMAWQRPSAGLAVTTKFLDNDYTNSERYTGIPGRSSKKVGRRARFENKFAVPGSTSTPGPGSGSSGES